MRATAISAQARCEYDDTAVTYGAHNFEVGVRFRF